MRKTKIVTNKLDRHAQKAFYVDIRNGIYRIKSFRTKLVVKTNHAAFCKGCFPFAKQHHVHMDLSPDFLKSNKSINDANKLEPTSIKSRLSASGYTRTNQEHKVVNDGTQSDHMNETDAAQEGHIVQEGHDTNHVIMGTSSVLNNTSNAQDNAPRYPQQTGRTPLRLITYTLRHTKYMDEPTVKMHYPAMSDLLGKLIEQKSLKPCNAGFVVILSTGLIKNRSYTLNSFCCKQKTITEL